MTTEDIIKDLRYLCDQPAYAGVSETMTLAANAVEGLGLRFDECMQKHNDTRAELERLKIELAQAISERTPHDYGILRDQRDEARGDAAHWRRIAEHRQKELSALIARPEPSRLEIAAMLVAGRFSDTVFVTEVKGAWIKYALDGADALIAAAKEVTK